MVPYADNEYYMSVYGGAAIPDDELDRRLRDASRHIDTLTYNRIVSRGISNLTAFQQDIVREVCCKQADFEYENEDMIRNVLKSYSINGVSMSFGESWNMKVISGVAMQKDLYNMLSQTGLCSAVLGVRY